MSNFDFLKSYNESWAQMCNQAEALFVHSFPGPCAVELRKLGEEFAQAIVSKLGLRIRTPAWKRGKVDYSDRVNAIRAALVNSPQIPDALDKIRQIGNFNAHNFAHCVQSTAESLQKTYIVAAWFMETVVRSREPIPEYEPPVVQQDSEVPVWKKFLGTKQGKWAAVIASLLAILFGYYLATDEEHRWERALGRTLHLAVFVLVLILLALPFLVLANGLTIWQAYRLFVTSLSAQIGWNEYLIQALGLALLAPFFYSLRQCVSMVPRRRWLGIAVVLAMAISYDLMFYYATKDTPFAFGSGHVTKYYARTDQGIVTYDRPGFEPTTGQALLPVTPEVWREFQMQLKQGGEAMGSVDPATHDWFNPNTGAPMLWYSRSSDGKLVFFLRSGVNPRTGDQLLPVTRELEQSWSEALTPKPPRPITQRDELHAMLSPAASGGPGVLLLHQSANDREGADALARHLSGVNTSAIPADALKRHGLASRFYQGDSVLVRDVLSITHLKSLVVAEVTINCAKRSSLDADLLSCDLTANARKFDAHGNPAGSQMFQSTGAGFTQEAALDAAAERASASLVAFARQ